MTAQEVTDREEGESIARYVALRAAFGPCGGAEGLAPGGGVKVQRQSARKGWADWLPASGD